jgi:hypothetical protein
MENLHKSSTYNALCDLKPVGDLGINISEEKAFLDGLKLMVEDVLRE